MCAAVSLRPQFGHFSSGHSRPEYFPTWTLVPQKPVCCLDLHILYMSDFDDIARLRCSQSTSSKRSCVHFLVSASMCRATSLLAWNRTGCDTSLVILFPHITMATSSRGRVCVGVQIVHSRICDNLLSSLFIYCCNGLLDCALCCGVAHAVELLN